MRSVRRETLGDTWHASPIIRLCAYVAAGGLVALLITFVAFVAIVDKAETKFCAAHPESVWCEP